MILEPYTNDQFGDERQELSKDEGNQYLRSLEDYEEAKNDD